MKISVDPGVSGTGYAVWDQRKWKRLLTNPIETGNLYPKGADEDYVGRTMTLLEKLEDIICLHGVRELWCEMPEFFDDAGGHMAAKKGDLGKLTFFVGAIAGLCYKHRIRFRPVHPSQWKGQTSKEQVERKICHILPGVERLKPKSHTWDAIGIGIWAQGYYKR